MENKPFKILSIDGGGIKGLYSASILAQLEKKSGVKSTDCFDMICGTSTGGLIALGLASGKSANELAEMYISQGKKIFPTSEVRLFRWYQRSLKHFLTQTFFFGKFSNKALKEVLESQYEDLTLGDLNNLVLVPSFNLVSGMPRMFKFPHKEGDFFMDKDILLVDAGLATSAAPTYLPIHEHKDKLYVDGGVWANNPALCGLLEAIKYFVGPEKEYSHVEILSIASISNSSGWAAKKRLNRSFIGWRAKLMELPMDGQAYFTHFFLETALERIHPNSKYVRIESPKLSHEQMILIEMDRADSKAIKTIKSLGEQEGVTKANDPNVMHFFKTAKTYKTI
ncbi:MAG: patatin-like phospholipase family protein [Flavobacteriales bacterium]|nr:patatin-like phospholipase family protein [Flavobacteriales bacterium]